MGFLRGVITANFSKIILSILTNVAPREAADTQSVGSPSSVNSWDTLCIITFSLLLISGRQSRMWCIKICIIEHGVRRNGGAEAEADRKLRTRYVTVGYSDNEESCTHYRRPKVAVQTEEST